jgi:hypothetical protein
MGWEVDGGMPDPFEGKPAAGNFRLTGGNGFCQRFFVANESQ